MRAEETTVVIGAGPAGLTAAYELAKAGRRSLVLEKQANVGGLSATARYKGFYFDMGGHRFFTQDRRVMSLWNEILGEDFLMRPRLSRIYYQGKFFLYPPTPMNVLKGLGVLESLRVTLSYIKWQIRPFPQENTFEQWVTNRFGRRFFRTFFETYTEKVWGISCSELNADWAAQRIKDLSLRTALLNMLGANRGRIRSLIEEFHYPRRGPGMLWERCRDLIEDRGGEVRVDADVRKIKRNGSRIESVVSASPGRPDEVIRADHFLSSMPLTEFVLRLDPPPPQDIAQCARSLSYRDFLTVCLIVDAPDLFPDNWIYVHDRSVRVARIQNFKNWSPEMVPDTAKTSVGMEYFCNEGDELWNTPDAELIDLARRELATIQLAREEQISDGCVVRVPKAYPVYDSAYRDQLEKIRGFVDGFENMYTMGRNGLHRYNNQDHAMLTGMLAVRNVLNGERHDLWNVNVDRSYHEELREPSVPEEDVTDFLREHYQREFAKLDGIALGASLGIVAGMAVLAATWLLLLKGGSEVGPNIAMLAQYWPGYRVTFAGSFVGLGYALVLGFGLGFLFALVRNAVNMLYAITAYRRARREILSRFTHLLW